jgi:hypothetical protein
MLEEVDVGSSFCFFGDNGCAAVEALFSWRNSLQSRFQNNRFL